MRDLTRQIELLAQSESSLALLIGEHGTGKGWLAEYIHARSARSDRPFLALSCVAMGRSDLAAEVFGAGVPGSDGGVLGAARGGTVFLDEVGELPLDSQARLLDMIERGLHAGIASDVGSVRIIAASSRDLVNEVNEGRFREDLYYRLGAMPVHLPPLRARTREDLTELITATFTALSVNMSNAPLAMGGETADALIAYSWPGNIRELRSALERGLLAAAGEGLLRPLHLPAEVNDRPGAEHPHTPRTLVDVERAHIHRTLRAHKLNRTHAARELGISRATLIKKIKQYGLVYRVPGRA